MRNAMGWIAAVWGLSSACGGPLVDDQYRGEPLFRLRGQVASYQLAANDSADLRASLFWSPSGETTAAFGELIEQTSVASAVTFPATFELNVFEPPEERDLVAPAREYALGRFLVYQVKDGAKTLVGGSLDRVLLYAPKTLDSDASPTGREQPAGFSLIDVPATCDRQAAVDPSTSSDCLPQLGAGCASDLDCGPGGQCAGSLEGYTFPGGYCLYPDSQNGCRPAHGISTSFLETVWLRRCAGDQDCPREGHACRQLGNAVDEPCLVCWPKDVALPAIDMCGYADPLYAIEGCGKKVGEPCGTDLDCDTSPGAATCLQVLEGQEIPGGYCTVDADRNGCEPALGLPVDAFQDKWLLRCATSAECRESEGYFCDGYYLACMPASPILLEIYDEFPLDLEQTPLCYDPQELSHASYRPH